MIQKKSDNIDAFDFAVGKVIAGKYVVLEKLGGGWEGEVYMVLEKGTRIERAAKFFYPKRNIRDQKLNQYARKLHKLRNCSVVIQYNTVETIRFKNQDVSCLISEYVEGEVLAEFLKRHPGKRLTAFEGIHLLYQLARGLDYLHNQKEYHGDLHSENIIIRRKGLSFDVKIIDMFHWGDSQTANIRKDVCDLVRVLYDSVGGAKHYANQPSVIKQLCCGLKTTLILKRFKTAGQLARFIEDLEWDL